MIRIEVDDREVREAIEALRRRLSNMKPAMHAIGQALMEGSRERILSGRDWTRQPFAPNRPATLARKKGTKPLIDQKTFVTSRLHYEAEADQVTVGSNAVQSAVLQFGARKGAFGATKRGKIPWGDIPARRYLPVTADGRLDAAARALVLDTIAAHLRGIA
jgi:phage gpG-like protein